MTNSRDDALDDDQHRPRRRGFLASLADGLTPQPIPDDDDGPLVPPRGVITATILAISAGVVYVATFGLALLGAMRTQWQDYQRETMSCVNDFGGYGTAITATSPTGHMANCQALIDMPSESDFDSYRSFLLVLFAIYVLMGIGLVAAGWFLRFGRTWARRTVVAIAIITVISVMVLGISNLLTMLATLLMMIALLLCYLSSGATYFMRVKARSHT